MTLVRTRGLLVAPGRLVPACDHWNPNGVVPEAATLNEATVQWLLTCFEITTATLTCSKLPEFSHDPTGRLIDICRHVGADTYLSGSGAREYLDMKVFEASGIALEFQDYLHPTYAQCYGDGTHASEFVSHLSAVDALFNCGGGSRQALNV